MYLMPDLSDKGKVMESMRLAKELIKTKGRNQLIDVYNTQTTK